MGRLIRGAAAGIAAVAICLTFAGHAAAFDGFGDGSPPLQPTSAIAATKSGRSLRGIVLTLSRVAFV